MTAQFDLKPVRQQTYEQDLRMPFILAKNICRGGSSRTVAVQLGVMMVNRKISATRKTCYTKHFGDC